MAKEMCLGIMMDMGRIIQTFFIFHLWCFQISYDFLSMLALFSIAMYVYY